MTITPTIVNHDSVYALAAANHTLYAARTSGLYRSHDTGTTWIDSLAVLQHPQPLTVTAVAVQGETIFAGAKGAVLCSHDAGDTWTIVGLSSPPPHVVALTISPNFAEDGTVAAGTTNDGVFLSTDRGVSWIAWNFGLLDTHIFALAFSPSYKYDRTLIAGTESGIFISKNGGRGWNEVDFPIAAAPVISVAFSPNYSRDGVVFAGSESSGLFISHDKSVSWKLSNSDLISGGVNAISSTEPPSREIWVLLEDKVVFSSDNGKSWEPSEIQIPSDKTPMAMALIPTKEAKCVLGFADGELLTA